MGTRSRLRDIYAALDQARSYPQWLEAADAYDRLTGLHEWREQDDSPHYDAKLLRSELREIRRLRLAEQAETLARVLTRSIYRHKNDISTPELYGQALTGTKKLVDRYLDEVEAALRWLAVQPVPGIPLQAKRRRFQDAWHVFGRSALLLSGGATWGFHHLGVVKALHHHGLLPHIISGASTGAMVAAGICSRTDPEITALFADTDQMRLDGLLRVDPLRAARDGAVLDPDQLHAVLRHNVGDWTFQEAFARTGRVLAIPVSPTRTRQKTRLLDHLTAPEVLVASAALASSALPGLFPPVVLQARAPDGSVEPYIDSERWADGSITSDLPKLGLARLHNVNHFIASQTNPHVLPFVHHHGQRGLRPAVAGLTSAVVRAQGATLTDIARRLTKPHAGPIGQLAERAYALVNQDYRGDIDIHPQFRPGLFTKVVKNPTRVELAEFIAAGQRAVWPRLHMIENQTRLGRVFRECVGLLEQQQGA